MAFPTLYFIVCKYCIRDVKELYSGFYALNPSGVAVVCVVFKAVIEILALFGERGIYVWDWPCESAVVRVA